jgi:glycolate oxidase
MGRVSTEAEHLRRELAAYYAADVLIVDQDRVEKYRRDRAEDPRAGVPLAVIRAESTEHVQAALRFATLHGIPVVPRGAGSGLSGGATAIDGCLVVSLERMKGLAVDKVARVAYVEPGVINSELKAAAAAHGLWYPPDPSSFEISSIGGNVATNAGGLCCLKYGTTGDYVLGLTVVLASGAVVEVGGPRLKDAAGLNLTRLFVGSEGVLGIVTRAILRLVPRQDPVTTVVASFPTLIAATDAVAEIMKQTRPSMLEFMDRVAINAVEDMTGMGLDRTAAALLVIQSDEPASSSSVEQRTIANICQVGGATEVFATTDAEEAEAFVVARRLAVPAVERLGSLLLEDVGVPLSALGTLVDGVAAIADAQAVTIALIAHAGDGNTHPLIVFDPADNDCADRARQAFDDIMRLALSLGGTITGEHGVGRLKQPWLTAYLGPEVHELNRVLKNALDPRGILNPGAAV